MKSTGITRQVDELGRFVLPIEIRRALDIQVKDALEIFTDEDRIVLKKYQPACAFRKMIYKKHFSKDYLELELQKKELETRISRALEASDCEEAQRLCNKLLVVVEQMQRV